MSRLNWTFSDGAPAASGAAMTRAKAATRSRIGEGVAVIMLGPLLLGRVATRQKAGGVGRAGTPSSYPPPVPCQAARAR